MRLTADDRAIFAIALPTFATLIVEPLMLVADTIVIGHVGTSELAGLAVGSTVLTTIVGLCIFLAYGSTAAVSRLGGAGQRKEAFTVGTSAVWLAVSIGLLLAITLIWISGPLSTLLASDPPAARHSTVYLSISALGLPGMLVVLAITGVLRGLGSVKEALYVTVGMNALNIMLNLWLVLALELGVAGCAAGTVIAQSTGAAVLCWILVARSRVVGASWRPRMRSILQASRGSVPLLLRTLSIRAALFIAMLVAATQGDVSLAAHQIAMTITLFIGYLLDALAIAGQTLIGNALGSGDLGRTRKLTNRTLQWGLLAGLIATIVLLLLTPLLPALFSSDPRVRAALLSVLIIVALLQPVSAIVFMLDGVLIGAGDAVYLAWTGILILAAYLPAAFAVWVTDAGLAWLWGAYVVFMLTRAWVLVRRTRTDDWMRVGATLDH